MSWYYLALRWSNLREIISGFCLFVCLFLLLLLLLLFFLFFFGGGGEGVFFNCFHQKLPYHRRLDVYEPILFQLGTATDNTESYILILVLWSMISILFFLSFCVPQLYLWGSWVRFLRMWPLFNPTIKVVTFRLRGWCVLGVYLLPAFTRLGHERQDHLSLCGEMHVCTD